MPATKKSGKGSTAKKNKGSAKATNKGGNRSTKKHPEGQQAWERGESTPGERYIQN